jgi:hypothetical protein
MSEASSRSTGRDESPAPAAGNQQLRGWDKWDKFIDRVADIPWALIVLFVLALLLLFDLATGEDVRAFATAAGLLGIGHGIHTGSKHLTRSSGPKP